MTAATPPATVLDDRPLRPALLNGWRRRCPACGTGRLLRGYLKVVPACPACGADLHHQRADDGPAYATILIVGHLLVPFIPALYALTDLSPAWMATVLSAAAVGLSLFLLPRLKGMFVAVQWSRRMHGFGSAAADGPAE